MSRGDVKSTGESDPLDLFHSGIQTQTTDATYTTILRIVLCAICEDVLSGTFEERARELVGRARKDPTWARDLMHSISSLLRRRTELPRTDGNYLAPSSIASYFAPLKKLLDMNDIGVPWSRIYGTFPPKERMADTRGWHREEIQKMLRHAPGTRHRAVILTIASSGVRVGGLELDWGDLTPIVRRDGRIVESSDAQEGERVECAALRVYRGSREEYATFVTPEAYEALMEYRLEWQQDVGRPPGPTDPIFKKKGPAPDRLGAPSIDAQLNKLLHRTGLRQPAPGERRYKVPALHGFRRFWNKTMKDAISDDSPVSSLTKKEYMMGHAGMTALDRNYYHAHTLELAREYINAVPDLTIDDAERLRRSNKNMSANIQELEAKNARIEQLERKMQNMEKMRVESLDADRLMEEAGKTNRAATEEETNTLKSLMRDLEAYYRQNIADAMAARDKEIADLKRMVTDLSEREKSSGDQPPRYTAGADLADRRGTHPHHSSD